MELPNVKNDRIIAITGTPGTGKTTLAQMLSEDLDYRLIELNEVIEDKNIYELDSDGTRIVEPQNLRSAFEDVLTREKGGVVVEGHLSHLLPSGKITDVLVLRTEPSTLRKRLKERGYSDRKLQDNIESEALDVILEEAVREHGEEEIYEINTTQGTPSECVNLFKKALRGEESLPPGSVDWLEEYFEG